MKAAIVIVIISLSLLVSVSYASRSSSNGNVASVGVQAQTTTFDYNITNLYTGVWTPATQKDLTYLASAFSTSYGGGKLYLMIDTRNINQTLTGVRATLRIYNVEEDTSNAALVRWLLYGTYSPVNGELRLSSDLSLHPDESLGFNYSVDAAAYKAERKVFMPCSSCSLFLKAIAKTTTDTQSIQFVSASSTSNNDVPLFTSVPVPATNIEGVSRSDVSAAMDVEDDTHWLVSLASAMSPVNHVAAAFPQLSVALMAPSPSAVAKTVTTTLDDIDSITYMDMIERDESTSTSSSAASGAAAGGSGSNDGVSNAMTLQAIDFGGIFESHDPANSSVTYFKLILSQISAVEILDPSRVMNYVIMVAGVSLGQYLGIKRQLKYSESQARMMKVSLWSIFMFGLIDFLFFTMHYSIAFLRAELFTYFLVLAIGGFAVFFQELKFMLSMWKVRHPESFNQGAEHTHREFRKLAFRFTMILLAELLLAKFIPSISAIAVFAYLFWIPQIVLNAREDVRNALQPSFIIGWSILHLVVPMYMLMCPVNLFMAAQPAIAWVMVSVVIIQVIVLLLQDKLGPRFFVPARFLPKKYDYHRAIPLRRVTSSAPSSSSASSTRTRAATDSAADIEMPLVSSAYTDSSSELPPLPNNSNDASSTDGIAAAVASDSSASGNGAAAAGAVAANDEAKRLTDVPLDTARANNEEEDVCPICYCEFEANGSRFLTMVTPCDHVFHTTCLSRWMDQKMECPTCRGPLPPL